MNRNSDGRNPSTAATVDGSHSDTAPCKNGDTKTVTAQPATDNPPLYEDSPSARRRSAVRLLAERLFARAQR